LKIEEWPAADQDVWRRSLVTSADPFEESGSRARFARRSNEKLVKGYGRWLGYLSLMGALDANQTPGDRITPAAVATYVDYLSRINSGYTILTRLQELHDMACVIDPAGAWSWIRKFSARVRSSAKPARNKRARMVTSSELYGLGLTLMETAETETTKRRQATRYRDGLIIALLASRPLRLENFVGLELGRTLVKNGSQWWITIPSSETKNRKAIETPFPDALLGALGLYLSVWRPMLEECTGYWKRDTGSALWLSSQGSPMGRQALYDRHVKQTKAGLGKAINPHLVRDCAATSIAIDDPGHIFVATQLLGHSCGAVTERHYNQAKMVAAATRYQAVVHQLRRDGVPNTEVQS
jgi:site-specific recombinase XerD